MNRTTSLKLAAALLLAGQSLPDPAVAQVFGPAQEDPVISFGVAVDVASRYVWRGLQVSDETNVQPAGWLGWGPFEIGTWGSHDLEGNFHEQDFWITYYMPADRAGLLGITVHDYYVSSDFGNDFFDLGGVRSCVEGEPAYGVPARCVGGPHRTEVVGSFISASAPVDLLLAYNFHNDPENALYGQASLRPSLAGFDLAFTVGGVFGRSLLYYRTDAAAVTNLTAGIGRSIVGLPFELPLSLELVHNPHLDETYYMARAGVYLQR
ncbi:MAG: hypothetical protein GEU90_20665 [Gemmatimonas sp.]|nr:hypothetical protein [Gemmatimonas sp.]